MFYQGKIYCILKKKIMLSLILEKIYYASPVVVIICGLIITGIYIVVYRCLRKWENKERKRCKIICINAGIVGYIALILIITLFSRETQMEKTISIIPFTHMDSLDKIRGNMMNILLFYPLGILAGTKWKRIRVILIGTIISLGIEISQYLWNLGYAEIDDIINNTIGMALGVGVMLVFEKILYNKGKKENEQKNRMD